MYKYFFKQDPINNNKDNESINSQIKDITLSFNLIYEFIDRGMKGLLTGDITSNLIFNLKRNLMNL